MKNFVAVLAALAVATPLTAQTSFGVRGGMTLSTLAVSEEEEGSEFNYGYQAGIHAAVTASLGSGVLLSAAYSQRGVTVTEPGVSAEGSLDLAYIDFGAFGKIPIDAGPYLLFGPTLGLRIACSATSSELGYSATQDCGAGGADDPFKASDFGVSGGVGISFDVGGRDAVVEVLYGFGILNIFDDDSGDSAKNRGFTIRAGMDFGG